ncbi:alpha/beta hydrolase family protein [Bacillus haynesii]|uniref:alpha/beta hydrolase family protein n=1 Tax=Bacillus haynesii TaxID=1925021 RepID=UPI00227E894C|nr:dienelactone hydrolase family protein [Bacillus haynesii]MCY7914323.1 dienelactone hydrolase family protein [Bacillus haynesii]MCY7924492.1 dienelactone hydrolase family protein [Bacillus haynesii]MCY8771464.1 dienelactone hydrolase family protein [Bacillus haynesii]MEC0788934.1 dienelactone hydrolase family protein [Bacillus haynesii]MEC1654243.1 dienelactone hydrolase family protein [Bacillus haynesii]
MRTFEILLTLLSFIMLFQQKIPRKLAAAAGFTSIGVLVGQLFFEGYRWQMVLIYLISAALAFIAIFGKRLQIRIWKPLKYGLYALTFVMLAVSAFLSVYLPVFDLPKPDGAYSVGTKTFLLTDQGREETLTKNPHDKRELMVQVSYPAQGLNGQKQAPLFPEDPSTFHKYIERFADGFGLPAFALDYWRYIKTNSYENAAISSAEDRYPVVVISHGFGTSRLLHASQAEHLASHGFIAVAIDHTYSTMATAFPGGRVTGLTTEQYMNGVSENSSKLGNIWTQDADFVINQLDQLNRDAFEGKLDMDNIGMMGHSFGGATAFNTAYSNPGIKAGINMDGSLYNVNGKQAISKPFLFMESSSFMNIKNKALSGKISDEEIKNSGLTKEEFNKMIEERKKEYKIIDQASMVYIEGTEHYNFTDLQLYSKLLKQLGMTGDIDGARSADIVNRYVLDFFNKHLKGTGGDLISKPNPSYPEVKFPKE